MPLKVVQTPGEEAAHSKAMRRMVNAYSLNMPCLLESSKTNVSSSITRGGEVVLLTGTTGALGSELLVDLVASEHVSRVYTYNRPMPSKTIRQRHQETFADRLVPFSPTQSSLASNASCV
jgi:FlaA1/EpsC-like NDP-sugar epimerase